MHESQNGNLQAREILRPADGCFFGRDCYLLKAFTADASSSLTSKTVYSLVI